MREMQDEFITQVAAAQRTGYTNFSQHSIGKGCGVPLPIELVSFDAVLQNDQGKHQLTTASEKNNDYFTIEKSTDAVNYTEVCKVRSLAHNGNSTSMIHYSAQDYEPFPDYHTTGWSKLISTATILMPIR